MLNFNPVRWTCLVHDTLKTSKYMSRSLDLNLRESLFDQEITSLQFVAILKGLCPSNSFASASLKISFQSALRIRKKNKSVKFGEGELFYTVDFIETIWGKTCTHVIVLHNCTISLFFSLLWILYLSLSFIIRPINWCWKKRFLNKWATQNGLVICTTWDVSKVCSKEFGLKKLVHD